MPSELFWKALLQTGKEVRTNSICKCLQVKVIFMTQRPILEPIAINRHKYVCTFFV